MKDAGVVAGYGTVKGKLVYIFSEAFNVRGGLLTDKGTEKILSVMNMALRMGAPLIQILDSVGGDVSLGMKLLASYGSILNMHAKLSGVVPQISIITGPCTGAAVLGACMSDVVIMTAKGELYVNSEETIEKQSRTYSAYGSYATAAAGFKNGSVHMISDDDRSALNTAKKILDYLPQNNLQLPAFSKEEIIEDIIDEEIDKLYAAGELTSKDFISRVVDKESILELNNGFGASIYTAFAKLNGLTIGVMSADSTLASGIDIRDCEKAARFVKMCNTFNISILSLVNVNGFIASAAEESSGLALSAASLVYALVESNVPKVSLIVGRSVGAGHVTFAGKEAAFDMIYALPNATICTGEPEIIVKQLYSEEIKASDNPKERERELIHEYLTEEASVYKAAEFGLIDNIIKTF
jgi:Acetyl-CoA carboxylase, carboxyltransferase component (subunits alpha and beta)